MRKSLGMDPSIKESQVEGAKRGKGGGKAKKGVPQFHFKCGEFL
jgi:hypothetical protein